MDAGMYERALTRTGKIVSGTSREQLDDPTPCTEWSARDLLNHLIGGCLTFAAGAKGEARPMDDGTDHCAEDHVAAFEQASRSSLEAFQEPGALERKFKMPWGDSPVLAALGLALADAVVHGWDLAKATNQVLEIDEDIAEELHGMTSSMMQPKGDYPRGDSFGEPVDVPDDAPAADRLLSYLGRQP